MKYYIFLTICLSFGSSWAKDVTVVFPQQIPPWVNNDGHGGIAVEIVGRALAYSGHNLIPEFVPFTRMVKAISDANVDAVSMVEGKKINGPYFYSDMTTKFTTSLISLSRNKLHINTIEDLYDKRVLAFLDANKVFPDVKQIANHNKSYEEISNQESQVALLFKNRVELILIDRNIFYFWRNTITKVNTGSALTFHDLPTLSNIEVESPTHTVFKDETLKDQFNIGLRQIRNSGVYQQIINKHLRWCTPAGASVE